MAKERAILDRVRAAIHSVSGLDHRQFPVTARAAEGTITLEGEVPDIAFKKQCLEAAAAVPGVGGLIDRLRVRAAQHMGDAEIRDHVRDALLGDPAFAAMALFVIDQGKPRPVREMAERDGTVTVEVADGAVTLTGDVPGLVQKRLAGVLAWWVPGVRDVINGLAVEPPEAESEAGVTDAVRIALEKDPLVNDTQIHVQTHGTTVVLTGLVPTDSERHAAALDAWAVFGVDRVINRIEVHR